MAHKKILITGATGFIGANLVRYFLTQGHDIYAITRPGSDDWRIRDIKKDIILREEDIGNVCVNEIKPDRIFHTAVYGGYSWQTDSSCIFRTNFLGTIEFLNRCITCGFESFLNTGSSSEYGFKNHPTTESDFLEPNSDYAVSKASATLYCQFKANELNLPISTLRLYSIYGEYEDSRRLIPQIILKGLGGEYPELVSPEIARDFTHVHDVISAYEKIATLEKGGIFNVGSGVQTKIGDVVNLAKERFKITKPPRFNSLSPRIWDTSSWVSDNSKLIELGWRAKSFEVGFDKTVSWFQKNLLFSP